MTEETERTVNLDKDTRKVKVMLDTSPQVIAKDEKIAQLNKKIGEQENLIKAMLVRDRAEFTPSDPKKPPENPENTAILTNEPSYQDEHVLRNIDYENSDIPLDWIRGKNEAEVIEKVEGLAKMGNKDCKNIMSKLTRKIIHDKPIDMTFIGSNIDFMRSPKQINENMAVEEQERRKKLNERLRQNRFKWRVN